MKKEKIPKQSSQVNYCKANEYNECKAQNPTIQKNCKYYIESFSGERCIFLNTYQCCGNPDAQRSARYFETK